MFGKTANCFADCELIYLDVNEENIILTVVVKF